MPKNKKNNFFWIVVIALYTASIAFSYTRIYINQDYPIFYSEEEIPDAFDILKSPIKHL